MTGVELSGVFYPLRYTVNAVCCLEEKMKGGLNTLLSSGLSSVRGLLWCGMLHQLPTLTLEDAGDLLEKHLSQGGSLQKVADALAGCLEAAGFFHPGERA